MLSKKIFLQIYGFFFLGACFLFLILSYYFNGFLGQDYLNGIYSKTALIEAVLMNTSEIDKICPELEKECNAVIILKSADGKIIYGPEKDYKIFFGHVFQVDDNKSYHLLLLNNKGYASKRMMRNGAKAGELHIIFHSVPQMKTLTSETAAATLIFLFIAGIGAYMISLRICRPLEELKKGLKKITEGELDLKLPSFPGTTGQLLENLNAMDKSLKERFRDITKQKNERDAVFEAMIEGIMAIDMDTTVISINKAALKLLGIQEGAEGKTIHELVRNPALHLFAEKILSEKNPVEGELVFHNGEDLFLQLKGSVICDADGNVIGGLIALTDITQIRKLERMRHDFVANVSHEIKTPITAIKGSIETLQSGAWENPADAERFMNIIMKHAERLDAIVKDILSLSSIEKENEKDETRFIESSVADIINTACELCMEKAEGKKVKIVSDCDALIKAEVDRPMVEQALVNLIDNAVKYSNENSSVEISVSTLRNNVLISVKDHGCGIAREHLSRLFERFYRVDKARSRKLGGTGLGLAIVKHIAQMHSGSVTVESQPGKGSVFTISLPENRKS